MQFTITISLKTTICFFKLYAYKLDNLKKYYIRIIIIKLIFFCAGGVFLRPDDGNVYTTLEPTLSSNPNVYFQRGNGMHPGMMY